MIAIVCIQCPDNNGLTGDFLREEKTREIITPTFSDLLELYKYMDVNYKGWYSISLSKVKL